MNSSDDAKVAFAKRLNDTLAEKGYTQRGSAQRLKREAKFEISDRAINKWLKAETLPDHHNIEALAKFLGVNFNWLAAGQGEKTNKPSHAHLMQKIKTIENGSTNESAPNPSDPEGTQRVPVDYGMDGYVPVISWVAAGSFSDVMPVTVDDAIDWIPRPQHLSKRAFGLIIQGRSMWPEFKPDEIIYVEPEISPWDLKDGDLVVIHCIDDKQATFKQLIIGDSPEEMYLKPLNPDWPDQKIVPMGECMLVGIVDSKVTRYR